MPAAGSGPDGRADQRHERQAGVGADELGVVGDERREQRALGDLVALGEHEHAERERVDEEALGRRLADVEGHDDAQHGPARRRRHDEQPPPALRLVERGTQHRGDDGERRHGDQQDRGAASPAPPTSGSGRTVTPPATRERGVAADHHRVGVQQPRERRGPGEPGIGAHRRVKATSGRSAERWVATVVG